MDGPNEKVKFTKENEEVDIDSSGRRRSPACRFSMFDRSSGSVLNPAFASSALETHYQNTSFQETLSRLRQGSVYLAVCAAVWLAYFAIRQSDSWLSLALPEAVSLAAFGALLGLSFAGDLFKRWHRLMAIVAMIIKAALLLASTCLLSGDPDLPHLPVFAFAGVVQACLVTYTLMPAPLFVSVLLGLALSCLFELASVACLGARDPLIVTAHCLLLLAVQIVGIQLHVMSQVRRRSTFLRLCEGARIKQALAHEKEAKNEMIKSLMPESVAKTIMSSSEDAEVIENAGQQRNVKFRKFNVNKLDNVSVLFADIVGFTNMSSGKEARHLVHLLNDLFGRFDDLCDRSGCEKIATLGDCYYCVAGCPEPKADHAECCVEMGRGMVVAIDQFDKDHSEAVNMRVGVHTGTVLCGIVGTMRFKFDVWSNDVTLANEMESSGQPGKVHVSKDTHEFVKDIYVFEKGQDVPDIRELRVLIEYYDEEKKGYAIKHTQEEKVIETFFVVERYDKRPPITLDKKNVVRYSDILKAPPVQEQDVVAVEVKDYGAPGDDELIQVLDKADKSEFSTAPISPLTLSFTSESVESEFRQYGCVPEASDSGGLNDPRVSPMVDTFAFVLSLLLLCAGAVLASPAAVSAAAAGVSLAVAVAFLLPLALRSDAAWRSVYTWLPRNALGSLVMLASVAAALAGLAACPANEWSGRVATRNVFVAGLSCFTLFTFFCSWTKSLSAVCACAVGCALVLTNPIWCSQPIGFNYGIDNVTGNATATALVRDSSLEFVVGCVQLLLLILCLNRLYEISFRQTFHCEQQAADDKAKIRKEKGQVEMLLHNIIPYYIETQM